MVFAKEEFRVHSKFFDRYQDFLIMKQKRQLKLKLNKDQSRVMRNKKDRNFLSLTLKLEADIVTTSFRDSNRTERTTWFAMEDPEEHLGNNRSKFELKRSMSF